MPTNLCLVCKTKAGVPCAFPFLYKRKHHYECITDDNDGTPWCGTGHSALGRPDVFGTRLYYTNETGNCMSDCPGMLVYPKFIIFTERRSQFNLLTITLTFTVDSTFTVTWLIWICFDFVNFGPGIYLTIIVITIVHRRNFPSFLSECEKMWETVDDFSV